jgi:hypothetical protein
VKWDDDQRTMPKPAIFPRVGRSVKAPTHHATTIVAWWAPVRPTHPHGRPAVGTERGAYPSQPGGRYLAAIAWCLAARMV